MSLEAEPVDREAGRRKLKGPGIALLCVGLLGLLSAVGSLAFAGKVLEDVRQNASMPEQQRHLLEIAYGAGAWVIHGFGALLGLLTAGGGLAMMNAKARGLAWAGAIAAMLIPSCCCCVAGIGVGIWAILALTKPEARAAFS
jgi:hypothetical protein